MNTKRANSWKSFSFQFAFVESFDSDTSPAWTPDVLFTCVV